MCCCDVVAGAASNESTNGQKCAFRKRSSNIAPCLERRRERAEREGKGTFKREGEIEGEKKGRKGGAKGFNRHPCLPSVQQLWSQKTVLRIRGQMGILLFRVFIESGRASKPRPALKKEQCHGST